MCQTDAMLPTTRDNRSARHETVSTLARGNMVQQQHSLCHAAVHEAGIAADGPRPVVHGKLGLPYRYSHTDHRHSSDTETRID